MREGFSLGRMMSEALEANLRCMTLASRVANSVAGISFSSPPPAPGHVPDATAGSPQPKAALNPQQPQSRPAAILLEGPVGSKPTAHFVIVNHLPHEVSARVEVTPLATRTGRKLQSRLQFEKRTIVLAPGQQVVARIGAPITAQLPPNEACQGEIRVEGIPGASVPVVLRRVTGTQPVPRSRRLTAGVSAMVVKRTRTSQRRRRKTA